MATTQSTAFTVQFHNGSIIDEKPFTLLFATDKDGVIGDVRTDSLPWRCRPDLDRFKAVTMGHVVVVGAKTYISLVKTWPNHQMFKGRDVVVVFGTTQADWPSIERERFELEELASHCGKQVGERLKFIPVPRSLLTCYPVDQRLVHRCQDALRADLLAFRTEGQKVFIIGGAAMLELMFETCGNAHITLIHHQAHIAERAYLGLKAGGLFRSLSSSTGRHWDVEDVENNTRARYYSVLANI